MSVCHCKLYYMLVKRESVLNVCVHEQNRAVGKMHVCVFLYVLQELSGR